MKSSAICTVYIPCKNYGKFLRQAIDSVLKQVFIEWELFLIDEGSSDESLAIMKEYESRNPEKIFVIENEKAVGLQRVANLVLRSCSGRYFIRLDADDWLDPYALLLMVGHLERFRDVGIVFGDYYLVDVDGHKIGLEESSAYISDLSSGHRPPHGACTMFRARELKSVGGYSEAFDAQDGWDIWLKLCRRTQTARIALPLFFYRQHQSSLSQNRKRLLDARAQIFHQHSGSQSSYQPRVLAVVGAKKSYENYDDMPFREFNGKTLLERALYELGTSNQLEDIVLSSDSCEVIDHGQALIKRGLAPKHFGRLRSFITPDNVLPVAQIIQDGVDFYRECRHQIPDIVVFCGIHTVELNKENLERSLDILTTLGCDSVVSVSEERDMVFKASSAGVEIINPGRVQGVTHAHERLFKYDGAMIVLWADQLFSGELLGSKIGYLETVQSESFTRLLRD